MANQRILSINEARTNYVAPVRRAVPHPRASVLATDPAWLHAGLTYRLKYGGEMVDLFTISAMAAALGRSVVTVRRLEAIGIIPASHIRTPGRGGGGRRRLYTREQIIDVAIATVEAGLFLKRPRRWSEPLLAA